MTAGEMLKKLRNDKGLSQSQLGRKTGMSPSQISQYELGYYAIGVKNLAKFATILGCQMSDIDDRVTGSVETAHLEEKPKNHFYIVDEMLRYLVESWGDIPAGIKIDILHLAKFKQGIWQLPSDWKCPDCNEQLFGRYAKDKANSLTFRRFCKKCNQEIHIELNPGIASASADKNESKMNTKKGSIK